MTFKYASEGGGIYISAEGLICIKHWGIVVQSLYDSLREMRGSVIRLDWGLGIAVHTRPKVCVPEHMTYAFESDSCSLVSRCVCVLAR